MKIFLLGFMGTGKTYWGQMWANQNGLHFFDLDTVVEEHTGLSIPQIFKIHGESFFREEEHKRLLSFGKERHFILSTGGGTPCFYNNMQWMNENGLTIYLKTPIPILKDRLSREKIHRPLIKHLNDDEIERFIKESIQKREKYYNKAHIIIPTESISDITFEEIKRRYV